jgi:hypothetical protein
MNSQLLSFFRQHHAAGRVGLVGADDAVGSAIRAAEVGVTPDGKPSKWSHTFLMGHTRPDGRTDGSIYIFESDLSLSVQDWEVQNGVMKSRLVKWCRDEVSHGRNCIKDPLEIAIPATSLLLPRGGLTWQGHSPSSLSTRSFARRICADSALGARITSPHKASGLRRRMFSVSSAQSGRLLARSSN